VEHESGQQAKRWVINLCSLDAPMSIPQPRASRLTRFSFFLSHYREDDRRRYRLLMGYFPNVAAAEKWLETLQRIYPEAFISEEPAAQPDLMHTTQTLRVLDLGQVGTVQRQAQSRSGRS